MGLLLSRWQCQRVIVGDRLLRADRKMKAVYEQWVTEEEYVFQEGDRVWVRQRCTGKLLPRSLGPCDFLGYLGSERKSARVQLPSGRVWTVSTIHLCPASV